MRELSGPLSLLIEMVTFSAYCNEPFSLGVLQLLKVRTAETSEAGRRLPGATSSTLCSESSADPAGDGSAPRAQEHLSDAARAAGEFTAHLVRRHRRDDGLLTWLHCFR